MSALLPEADIRGARRRVCFGPIPDSCTAAKSVLFDHLIGAREQGWRHFQSERPGRLEVDDHLEFRWLHDGEITSTHFSWIVSLRPAACTSPASLSALGFAGFTRIATVFALAATS